jgi:hypothetical protein
MYFPLLAVNSPPQSCPYCRGEYYLEWRPGGQTVGPFTGLVRQDQPGGRLTIVLSPASSGMLGEGSGPGGTTAHGGGW